MTQYHNFIGIDIGKNHFFAAPHQHKEVNQYPNDVEGIRQFLDDYSSILKNSLCVLETTGGYEMELLYTLCSEGIAVHRANTRKVKRFIQSFGNAAKTDALDTKWLAKYGADRSVELVLFTASSHKALQLFQLVQRRTDLKKMLVAEKNRSKSPSSNLVRWSCDTMIKTLFEQLTRLTQQIKELVRSDDELRKKHRVLLTIPGIGDIVAYELLALLPELGTINRRQIASLVGLAPIARDSGKSQGYRKTGYGRKGIKSMLFMAAMAASNSNSRLKDYYEKLIAKGKKKKVALTALMRKIVVIANARLKEALQKPAAIAA